MMSNALSCVVYLTLCIINVNRAELFLSNLNTQCMRCLCAAASGCNLGAGCVEGFCGPYQISRAYWVDAGRQTLLEDDFAHPEAFSRCTRNYKCAQNVVQNYIAKFAKDCNADSVTDCEDYAMMNYNGGYSCGLDLNRDVTSRNYVRRFRNCMLQSRL